MYILVYNERKHTSRGFSAHREPHPMEVPDNMMTRTAAREIAVHFAFELGFSDQSASALLEQELTPERFAELAESEPLYAEFPDEQQLHYIRRLVSGIGDHEYELDGYIEKYAIGWKFHRIPRIATITRLFTLTAARKQQYS